MQSNYLPWRGYFDLMRSADEFILMDSVQYTRQDWRNRNAIKTPQGIRWITIPIVADFGQRIDETRIASKSWVERHIRTLEMNYRRASGFGEVAPWLLELLAQVATEPLLSAVNEQLLVAVARKLGITTRIRRCTDLIEPGASAAMSPTARLVALCQAAGGQRYLTGPAASTYLDEACFMDAGIKVAWMDYSGYPEYPQLWGPFEPRVSIVDLLFNTGSHAPAFF
jgi:hypothetical protein